MQEKCEEDEKFWQNQWGNKILFDHGSRRASGVAVLFGINFSGSVIDFSSSSEGRWILVVIQFNDLYFILVNVYGFNNSGMNATLMSKISLLVLDKRRKFPSVYDYWRRF